ncbi:MAG: HEAT repeat domain-containing protein [Planctomycetes bacterium]|nr:HEAT repeat domain-containing protein [Planctomycetota bacterium]
MMNSTDPALPPNSTRPDLADDLPPVQPPSAGFIVQLFVVPGLIVLAVVAVWALFGRIAAGEQDWHALVEELQSQNGHIRNRAMYGLAQVLDQDRRRGERGQHLTSNSEIATALSDQLTRELKSNSSSKESIAIQQYLTRAVGLLDSPKVTMPPLRLSLDATRDMEIRKSGVASIAMIAGRAFESGTPLDDPETVTALTELSADSQPLMRQTAAFALGLFQSDEANQQLHVLLGNEDWKTCVNAAIALSRHGSMDGLPVFKRALTEKPSTKPEEQVEYFMILTNSLKALSNLGPQMSDLDKAEFREILKPLVNDHAEVRIRVDAQNALQMLK